MLGEQSISKKRYEDDNNKMLDALKEIDYSEDFDKNYINIIRKFFDVDLIPKKIKEPIPDNVPIVKEPEIEEVKLKIDIDKIIWEKNPAYFRNNKGLIVSVFIGKDPSNKKIAKKFYRYQLEKDKESFEKEIQIMTLLSNRSSPHNCFLEIYRSTIETKLNQITLYMEAHEHTLIDILSAKKARKNKFDRDLLHKLIIKLI